MRPFLEVLDRCRRDPDYPDVTPRDAQALQRVGRGEARRHDSDATPVRDEGENAHDPRPPRLRWSRLLDA